jgi:protein TonB
MTRASPLSSELIVSSRSGHRVFDRLRGLAVVSLVYAAGLLAALVAPLLVLDMMSPHAAPVMPPIFVSIGHGARPVDLLPPKAIRPGDGRAPGHATTETRHPPIQEPVQPEGVPLAPPETRTTGEASQDAGNLDGTGDGTGGDPEGLGTEEEGQPRTLCDGCLGDGGGGTGEPGPGSILDEHDSRLVAPRLIPGSRVQPRYPEIARRARVEGRVILMLVIGADGEVGSIELVRGPDPRHGFDLAAIEAVKRWRYQPGLLNGRPVAVYATVVVDFTLNR